MAKNDNTILWIIGIGILLILVATQTNLFQKQTIDEENVGLNIHYYKDGVEVFPEKELFSSTISFSSINFFVFCVDLDPPSAPSSLAIASSGQNIILTWGAATDIPDCSGIDYYVISKNGNPIGNTSSDILTYTDVNVPYGTYNYTVYAVDKVRHSGPIITKEVIFSSSGINSSLSYNQISLSILVSNTGDVAFTNIRVVNATPAAFKNALPTTTQSLIAGQSKTLWTSSLIDTAQFESMTQPVRFWVNISAKNDYTGAIVYSSGYVDLRIENILI